MADMQETWKWSLKGRINSLLWNAHLSGQWRIQWGSKSDHGPHPVWL